MTLKAPVDPADPRLPRDFPTHVTVASSGAADFDRLDAGLPLLLLPIRIETRYALGADPPELRIRIFPDQIHIRTDAPEPDPVEAELTRRFWRGWHGTTDQRQRQTAWRALAGRVGGPRAGYLARRLQPSIDNAGELAFPDIAAPGPRPPAHPLLLPRRWLAVGYSDTELLFSVTSRDVDPDLRTAPDPDAAPWQVPASGLRIDEGLAWMFDYDRAVESGMAVTVPLVGNAAAAADGIAVLLVLGIDADAGSVQVADQLDDLLAAHASTDGLAFVPQGTPTNNTAAEASGWTPASSEIPDLPHFPDRPGPIDLPGGRVADPGGPIEIDPGPLDPDASHPDSELSDNGTRLATALGLAAPATLTQAAYGTDPERGRSRAMLRVTYEAVLGTFARRLLKLDGANGVAPATADELRQWCIARVTGGAPYGCLRIGPQPYGILPVRRSTATDTPVSTADHVQDVVTLLIDEWRRSVSTLAVLDPNRTDTTGAGEQSSAIATILATQPHPGRLFVRRLEEYDSLDLFERSVIPQTLYEFTMGGLGTNTEPPYVQIANLYAAETLFNPIETIDEQIEVWQSVYAALPAYMAREGVFEYLLDAFGYVGGMLDLLDGYQRRQRPVRWLALDAYNGVLGQTNTELVQGWLRASSVEWGGAGLVQAASPAAGQTASEYLADLRTELRGGASAPVPSPAPLLFQLVNQTLSLVPDDPPERDRVADALDLLASHPVDELDRLLRECLGLGMHRLDAWATSLATERLNRIRSERPEGLQIGAYGWVTDLAPRGAAISQGFVHAPSMAHAATAAVLRSGWQARGTDDPLSPVAVDGRSARIRDASWLLAGVRHGGELGDLLGYRFERTLHDLGADEQIRVVRGQVLAATDRPDVPPDQPVDGIELLDAYRAGQLTGLSSQAGIAIDELTGVFDAINDVGLIEAVHQLTGGQYERATALLTALATGEQAPPELQSPRTPRSGIPVEHRVLLLLDPDAPPPGRGWVSGIRDAVAPALEAWVAALLPPAGSVGFVDRAGGGAGDGATRTLAELGLSALDAVYLVGDDPATPSPALRTLAGSADLDPADAGEAAVSLADFALLAVELRRAIDSLAVADARDLRPAHTAGEPELDTAEALAAARSVLGGFATLLDRLDRAIRAGDPTAVTPRVEELARYGLGTGRDPGDLAAATRLYAAATSRRTAADAIEVDAANQGPGLARRLAAVIGGRVPFLGRFPVRAVDDGGNVVDLGAGIATAEEVDEWLDATGRVRADVHRLTAAGLLSELVVPDGGLRALAGQSPVLPGEGWVARHRAGAGGRLSVVAVAGPDGPPRPGADACGLVVDRWVERVPRTEQVTGVAVHFDAPSNRPPQAWLLAVTPDGEEWNLQLVLDTLLETLEWATLRAVGPEDLGDYGRAIPTVFVPGVITAWPEGS